MTYKEFALSGSQKAKLNAMLFRFIVFESAFHTFVPTQRSQELIHLYKYWPLYATFLINLMKPPNQ